MKTALVLLLCLSCASVMALETGERLALWTLLDQHDQSYTLDNHLQVLLVARSMDAAKLVDAALQGKPKGYLEQRHTVFLADISRMPKVIASLFAIPKMRDYNYRILLDRDARIAPRYPVDTPNVLWLDLRDGILQGQRSFADATALSQALEAVEQ
ncbi:FAD/FMN-containing dehydrogenase [Pseudomonas sp. CC6-YY-74]|uniref:FAD/FMN-containing dehydrogenase n=1 Tax=Pseudomonas sp. CC6-YY-74 TaxID=1930532 RepID=UPI0009A16368|nr:FAD/FMN-containing dehydrogenase [Pseudomonas sp. CC6-YY-74]